MIRLLAVTLGILAIGIGVPRAAAQTVGKSPPKLVRESRAYLETVRVVRALRDTTVSVPKNFKDGIALSAALEFLEQTAPSGLVTVIVDRDSLGADSESVIDDAVPIRVRSLPARAPVHLILERIVAQIPSATYIIRQGRIEIVNVEHATAAHLIKRPVVAVFEQRPLHEVLTDLADMTGLSINLDASVGDKAHTNISVVFRNNVSLEDALVNVTEMAGLRFVVLQHSVYVATPAAAKELEKERERKMNPPIAQ